MMPYHSYQRFQAQRPSPQPSSGRPMLGAASSPRPYHGRSGAASAQLRAVVAVPRRTWSSARPAPPTRALLADRAGSACRMNLDTEALIERAGFDTASLHRCAEPGPLGTSAPHIAGEPNEALAWPSRQPLQTRPDKENDQMMNSTVTQPAAITAPAPGSYRIDAVRSAITFTTRHLFGLGAVRGSFELRDREIHVTAPLSGCLARARSLPRASTPAIPAAITRSGRRLLAAAT
jgi:hypothetical protein